MAQRRGSQPRNPVPAALKGRHLWLEPLEPRLLPSYTVTDLGTLGGTSSQAFGLNGRGQAVGAATLPCSCIAHPVLWSSGGTLTDLGVEGAAFGVNDRAEVVGYTGADAFLWSRSQGLLDLGFAGYGSDINNRSEVVGRKFEGFGVPHAVLWTNGRTLELGTLGGTGSAALRITDAGVVVGWSEAAKSQHAFAWTAGTGMRDLGTLDGKATSSSGAEGVNDLGEIVGASFSQKLLTTHAVYFGPKGVLDLGTFGGFSEAFDINRWGQVVGDSFDATGKDRPFITELGSGQLVDLNSLIPPNTGWYIGIPRGINDAGQIVGSGAINGQEHGYLLTPDTSPGTRRTLATADRNPRGGPPASAASDSGGLLEAGRGPAALDVAPGGAPAEVPGRKGGLPHVTGHRPLLGQQLAPPGTEGPLRDKLGG
jgi:probable HAF family extracellular repeat protein